MPQAGDRAESIDHPRRSRGAHVEEAATTSGRHHFAIVSLALTCAHKGQPDRAAALHAELVQRAAVDYIPLTQLALTADAAGDRDQALAYARQALDQFEPHSCCWRTE